MVIIINTNPRIGEKNGNCGVPGRNGRL